MWDGILVGLGVGFLDGLVSLGSLVGLFVVGGGVVGLVGVVIPGVGKGVSASLGSRVGLEVGFFVGCFVGLFVGLGVGCFVGAVVSSGPGVGKSVIGGPVMGSLVGLEVGAVVSSGSCVGKGVIGGGVAGADVILGALQVSSEAGSKFSNIIQPIASPLSNVATSQLFV